MREHKSFERRRLKHAYAHVYVDISLEEFARACVPEPGVNLAFDFIYKSEKKWNAMVRLLLKGGSGSLVTLCRNSSTCDRL